MAVVDDLCQGGTPPRDSGHGQSLLVGTLRKHRRAEKTQHGEVKTNSYTLGPDLLHHPLPRWMNWERSRMNRGKGGVKPGTVENRCLDAI